MTLITSGVQCLPIAPGSAHSLPFKFGLTLWSASLRETSPRSTRNALSRFSNSPHSRIQQFCSVQSLGRPRHLHRNPQPLTAGRTTTLLPQNLFHGTRRLHSEIPAKDSEDVTQRPDGIAGDKFSALVSSSSSMPNTVQIVLERKMAATSGGWNKSATKANSTSPNMSSKDSTRLIDPDQSSSDKPPGARFFTFLLVSFGLCGLFTFGYNKGRKRGARDLTAQLPYCKIWTEREDLRKRQEKLKTMDDDIVFQGFYGLQRRKLVLAEKIETLDRKELEYLRQRAKELESELETQNVSIETVNARGSPHGAVNAGTLPDKTYARKDGGLCLETADLRLRDHLLGIEEKGPLGGPGCPNYSGAKADSSMRQAGGFLSAKIVPQDPNQVIEVYETLKTVPHEDDSMTGAKSDTETIGPPITKPGPGPASNVILESLSADSDAAKDEMGQIRQAKGALNSREKELEAQAKDRKKRIRELNAPKSERISSIASSMLLGSALAFGVTIIMSAIGS